MPLGGILHIVVERWNVNFIEVGFLTRKSDAYEKRYLSDQ